MTRDRQWIQGIVEVLPRESVAEVSVFRNQWTLELNSEGFLGVMERLKDEFGFRYLIDVTAVDRLGETPRFRVVYHLWNHEWNRLLRVATGVDGEPAVQPSVTDLWKTANWHEREVFDLFGIVFQGHPDLRRILLPPEWDGHPLRKDYPVEGHC